MDHRSDPELYFLMASQKGHLQLSFTELPDQKRQSVGDPEWDFRPVCCCVVDDERLAEQCASVRGFVVSSSDHETTLWLKVCTGVFQLFILDTHRLCPRVANNTLVLLFFFQVLCAVLKWNPQRNPRQPPNPTHYSSEEGDTKPQHRDKSLESVKEVSAFHFKFIEQPDF